MCRCLCISRSASIQAFLLEKTRIVHCMNDGMVFHVIRYLLQGADPETLATFQLSKINKQAFGLPNDEDSYVNAEMVYI